MLIPLLFVGISTVAQISIKVTDENGESLTAVNIYLAESQVSFQTDENGSCVVSNYIDGELAVASYVGYEAYNFELNKDHRQIEINLVKTDFYIDEITVSTGYFDDKKSNATGAVSVVDMDFYELRSAPSLLDRLEGIAPSLQFGRNNQRTANQPPSLRLRGQSTLRSTSEPLIIVDGFPFSGDINSLNPDDVENVTLLKDAASAAIWGARSGNGVLVITTKRGRKGKTNVSYRFTQSFGEVPDLSYGGRFMNSGSMMEIEKRLFEDNAYVFENSTLIPRYVEYLRSHADGLITDSELNRLEDKLRNQDVTKHVEKALYRPETSASHILSMEGGTDIQHFYMSTNMTTGNGYLKGNDSQRLGLNMNYTIDLSKNLTFGTLVNVIYSKNRSNGIAIEELNPTTGRRLSPYTFLYDNERGPEWIDTEYSYRFIDQWNKDDMLDWGFRPLNEINQRDRINKSTSIRSQFFIDYQPFKDIRINLRYNNQHDNGHSENTYEKDSYFVRNLVNKFTQKDGALVIPYGGIYESSNSRRVEHAGRLQINYNKSWGESTIDLLGGYEINEQKTMSFPSVRLYNFNEKNLTGTMGLDYTGFYETYPSGWFMPLPATSGGRTEFTNRFVSYYAYGKYSFRDKYYFTGSSRWDASNLYGVAFNQKGVPLWSAGFNWKISKENFYKEEWPEIGLRLAYGLSGNTNNNISAFPQIFMRTDASYQLMIASLMTAGNPGLRWEKVRSYNLGLDLYHRKQWRVSIDVYKKSSIDLLGPNLFDPTSGLGLINGGTSISNLINYASMYNVGFDAEVQGRYNIGALDMESTLMLSKIQNRVTNFMANPASNVTTYLTTANAPIEIGRSIDQLYTMPFYGLDAVHGQPLTVSGDNDYGTFFMEYPVDGLKAIGSSVPTLHGSILQTFRFKEISVSAVFSGKFGYYFRRGSIHYSSLFANGEGHTDFEKRWREPGDENTTNVPALPADRNTQRDLMYSGSEILIEKGDHIRLEDISISYRWVNGRIKQLPIKNVEVFGNMRRVGFIWRKTNRNLDPDLPLTTHSVPRSISLGIRCQF